jgi:hypothetical protein
MVSSWCRGPLLSRPFRLVEFDPSVQVFDIGGADFYLEAFLAGFKRVSLSTR